MAQPTKKITELTDYPGGVFQDTNEIEMSVDISGTFASRKVSWTDVKASLPLATLTTKGDLESFTTVQARFPIGSDDQVLTADSTTASGLAWKTSSGGGICGISDATGTYTYYATLTLAIAAAVSGDVVEVFADIEETGAVEIILKDGVNINFNGHTYTLNVATTENAITDNAVAVNCSLFNGVIRRIGGSASSTSSLSLHIDSATSNVTLLGVEVVCLVGTAMRNDGVITGGIYTGGTFSVYNTGVLNKAYVYASSGIGLYSGGGSSIFSCIGKSDGGFGIQIQGASKGFGSIGYSTSGIGFNASSFTGELQGCSGYSSGGHGLAMDSGSAYGCNGFSSSAYGIYQNSATGYISNCSAESTASYGAYVKGSVNNCSFLSSAGYGVYMANATSEIYNCTAQSTLNTTAGHAVYCGYGKEVFNCTLEVVNAGAYCITGLASTVKFGSNVFKGATTAVHANITQGQTLTEDTFGNILIG